MVRSRFHHVVTADDAQFGATMKGLPRKAGVAATGVNGAFAKASVGIKRATAQVHVLGGAIKSLGPAMMGFLAVGGISKIIENFDRVGKLAIRFGESAESIQRVGHAASLAGADVEKVAKAMMQGTRAAQEAMDGNQQYADAFERLNINAADFQKMNLEEKSLALSKGFLSAKTEGEGLSAIMEILGSRVAGELIPFFRQGGEAMTDAFDSVNAASQKTVDNIQKLNDRWTNLKAAAAGPLATLVGYFEGVIEAISGVVEALKGLALMFTEVVGGIAMAGSMTFEGNFAGAKAAFGSLMDDMAIEAQKAADKVGARMDKAMDAFTGTGEEPKAATEVIDPADIEDIQPKVNNVISADIAEAAFDRAQADIDKAAEIADADRAFKFPKKEEPVNRGGGMIGMMARLAQAAMKSGVMQEAFKASEANAAGFKGLGGLHQMQAARLSGIGPGQNTSLTTGGLGNTRALSRERFDARKAARDEAKDTRTLEEKSVNYLGEIRNDLRTAVNGSVS